jgi:hypothetical protein
VFASLGALGVADADANRTRALSEARDEVERRVDLVARLQ